MSHLAHLRRLGRTALAPTLFYAVAIAFLSACSSPYYNVMERLGVPKRDILVDRVAAARDSQEQAAQQFKSALERFTAVTGFKGGALQEQYDQLEAEYQRSETRPRRFMSKSRELKTWPRPCSTSGTPS